jgi:tetratricopeptide (TPR) repeat protein
MLFDLSSGRRKRVVQVVYAVLALLMGGSLLLFGIGSDAPGGLLDAVGLGSSSDNSSDTQYEDQINNAEGKLATDPQNEQALLNLARYHYLSANSQVSVSSEGAVDIPPEAQSELEQAVDAWQRYLKTDPKDPEASVAANATQAYVLLNDAEGAAEAQKIVAESQNSAPAYGQLAYYLYFDFQFDAADEAAAKAIELSEPSEREQTKKNLEAVEAQARKQKKQVDEAAAQGGKEAGEEQLTDPFGSLGGSGGLAPAPAP